MVVKTVSSRGTGAVLYSEHVNQLYFKLKNEYLTYTVCRENLDHGLNQPLLRPEVNR